MEYTGLALSSIFGKLFDFFGMIKETISYYNNKSSSIYMCMLDASKAFDRVDLVVLFQKLFYRGMCPVLLKLLIKIYVDQSMRVTWNGSFSSLFSVSNGVKQGGVLSPILFNIYVEDIVISLKKYSVGCHVSGMYCGIFTYADDITLLSPSSSGLNFMLKMCEEYAKTRSILFNSSKTKCMFFGKNANISPNPVIFMDTKLSFIDECVLLGIPLSTSMNINITGSVNSFYVKSNSVLRDFNLLPCDVKFSLLSTYCMDANYGYCRHVDQL